MSATPLSHHPVADYSGERQRARQCARAQRHRDGFRLHPVLEAAGWILAGAGIGSLAVIAGVWVLMRFTSFEDRSVEATTSALIQHHDAGSVN